MAGYKTSTKDPIVRGWYYDNQRDPDVSPLTTVALYYNKKWDPNATDTNSGGGTKNPDKWKPLGAGEAGDDGYSKTPLCTSVLSEDFNISVSNHWSDFGGDPLSELWDRAKPLAPFAKLFSDAVKKVNERIGQGETGEGTVSQGLSKLFQKLGSLDTNKITGYLNRKLIVQGTRFSYYGGTDISFGSLGMKFTVFPDWQNGNPITVNKQVDQIYPYTVGKYVQENLVEALKTYIGWQLPPGGYSPNLHSVAQDGEDPLTGGKVGIQEGTLKLEIGAYYSIPNLLVQDAQFTFSKQMVKLPVTPLNQNLLGEKEVSSIVSPLYCDVNLLLRPATKFSDDMMKQFVNGRSRESTINKLNQTLKDRRSGSESYL